MKNVPAAHAAPVLGLGGTGGTLHTTTTTTTTMYTALSAKDCAAVKKAFPAQAGTAHVCDLTITAVAKATWSGNLPGAKGVAPNLTCDPSQCGGGTPCVPENPEPTMDYTYYMNGPVRTYQLVTHGYWTGDTCSPPVTLQHDCYVSYTTPGTNPTVNGCTFYTNSDSTVTIRGQFFVSGLGLAYPEHDTVGELGTRQ